MYRAWSSIVYGSRLLCVVYRDLGVNFGLWFIFATPAMILALVLSWLYLSAIYCDDRYIEGSCV